MQRTADKRQGGNAKSPRDAGGCWGIAEEDDNETVEVDETGPIGGLRAALSGAMFWIMMCTSATEYVDADQ